jgi:hypothetical protein
MSAMSLARLATAAAVAALAAVAAVADGARATPRAFTLTLDGRHTEDPTLPAGLRHEGRFTASAPACAAGTARDVSDVVLEPLTVLRAFTCDDGSGSFTVLLPGVASEHAGSGTWKIVSGTGAYESLRGIGTYSSTLVSGSPNDFLSIKFHSVWKGTVDFDATPPTIQVAARAIRLRRPAGSYAVRVVLKLLNEAPGARSSYELEAFAGSASLAVKLGATTTGSVTLNLQVHPPKAARRLRLQIRATDAVGNERAASRAITLPRLG